MKNKQSIAYASVILMIGTVLAKLIGFAREVSVAYKFGSGEISDAFLLTNSVPSLVFGSLATVIGISYIPYCQSLQDQGDVDRFTSNLLNIMLVIMLVGCVLVNIFPEVALKLVASGVSGKTKIYAILMLRIVVFSIIPIIVSHLFQAYSQVKGYFHTTAWFGLITNTIIIAFTLIAKNETYYLLSVGVVLANTIGMILVIYGLKGTGFRYAFIVQPLDQSIKAIVLLTIPLLIENLAYSMSLLVDRNLASYLDTGTISGLSYAGTMGNMASTMIASSIITAIFPSISLYAAKGEMENLENSLADYSKWILILLAPVSLFIIFFAKDIVSFIFEHGAFQSSSSEVVWQSMICYSAGVVPAGLQTYYIRAFYSLKDMKTPVIIQIGALLCNIALNLVSVKYLRHIGISLSTSISYFIALVLLSLLLKRKHGIKKTREINGYAILDLVGASLCGVIAFAIIGNASINEVFVRLILGFLIYITLYIGFAYITQKEIICKCYNLLFCKFRRLLR